MIGQPNEAARQRRAHRPVGLLLAFADIVALVALAALLAVVAGGVAARALFDATGGAVDLLLGGQIELARLALMALVFAALPRAAAAGRLVRVDVLTDRLPAGASGLLSRLWSGLLAVFAGVLAWLLGESAAVQAARGDLTQDLALPLWTITAAAATGAAALAIAALNAALTGAGPDAAQAAGSGGTPVGGGPGRRGRGAGSHGAGGDGAGGHGAGGDGGTTGGREG